MSAHRIFTARNLALATVAVLAGFIGTGFALPKTWKAQQTVKLAVDSPDAVARMVCDPRQWPLWTVWNPRDLPGLEILPATGSNAATWSSPDLGHVEWAADTSSGDLEREPFHYKLRFVDAQSRTVRGTFRLEKTNPHWQLTWTAEGPLDDGPLSRWIGLTVVRALVRADMRASLDGLKEQLERTSPADNIRSHARH